MFRKPNARQPRRSSGAQSGDAVPVAELPEKPLVLDPSETYSESKTKHFEDAFAAETIGLMSGKDYKAKRRALEDQIDDVLTGKNDVATGSPSSAPIEGSQLIGETKSTSPPTESALGKPKSKVKVNLSFGDDDEEDSFIGSVQTNLRLNKDHTAITAGLPDRDRDIRMSALKDEKIKDFFSEREALKRSKVVLHYTFYDGSTNRSQVEIPREYTVNKFLHFVKAHLDIDFPITRSLKPSDFIVVVENIILDGSSTFFEMFEKGALASKGPLFDIQGNIDLISQERPIRIVLSSWYSKHKHIYPASLWNVFDALKAYSRHNKEIEEYKTGRTLM